MLVFKGFPWDSQTKPEIITNIINKWEKREVRIKRKLKEIKRRLKGN
jgi:hypothetical protein